MKQNVKHDGVTIKKFEELINIINDRETYFDCDGYRKICQELFEILDFDCNGV